MADIIQQYFLDPMIDKTGYNPVNTLTYAVIALAALYIIWQVFKAKNIRIDKKFVYGVLPFVLLGSTLRVVTDSIDNGVFTGVTPIHQAMLDSHIFDYNYFTISPGIYILIAAILFVTMGVLRMLKRQEYLGYVGLALWLPFFLMLVPFMQFAGYAVPILIMAAIPAYLAWRYFKEPLAMLMVAGHALDGAATFFTINIFGPAMGITYSEQHFVGDSICTMFGTCFPFYLLKVAVAGIFAYVLSKENEDSIDFKNFIALAIIIMGFAPGIRDMLRMMMGA
ncbi:MAG: DUF63 family protein [Candidatus Micrarchaeota archaeon]